MPICDDLCSAMLLMSEPQPLFGALEQGTEKAALPFVPHLGSDGANIDDGQDQQEPESLRALHLAHEILDRLGVGEVALE